MVDGRRVSGGKMENIIDGRRESKEKIRRWKKRI